MNEWVPLARERQLCGDPQAVKLILARVPSRQLTGVQRLWKTYFRAWLLTHNPRRTRLVICMCRDVIARADGELLWAARRLLSRMLRTVGRRREAIGEAEWCLAHAPNERAQADCLQLLGYLYWLQGRLTESLEVYTRAVHIAEHHGSRSVHYTALGGKTWLLIELDRFDEAEKALLELDMYLHVHPHVGLNDWFQYIEARYLLETGQPGRALEYIQALSLDSIAPYYAANLLAVSAHCLRAVGFHDDAIAKAKEAIDMASAAANYDAIDLANAVLLHAGEVAY